MDDLVRLAAYWVTILTGEEGAIRDPRRALTIAGPTPLHSDASDEFF